MDTIPSNATPFSFPQTYQTTPQLLGLRILESRISRISQISLSFVLRRLRRFAKRLNSRKIHTSPITTLRGRSIGARKKPSKNGSPSLITTAVAPQPPAARRRGQRASLRACGPWRQREPQEGALHSQLCEPRHAGCGQVDGWRLQGRRHGGQHSRTWNFPSGIIQMAIDWRLIKHISLSATCFVLLTRVCRSVMPLATSMASRATWSASRKPSLHRTPTPLSTCATRTSSTDVRSPFFYKIADLREPSNH